MPASFAGAASYPRRTVVSASRELFVPLSGMQRIDQTQRDTLDGGLFVSGFFFPGDIVGIESIGHTQYTDDAMAHHRHCRVPVGLSATPVTLHGKPGINAWMIGLIGTYLRRKDGDLAWSTALPADRRVLRFFWT